MNMEWNKILAAVLLAGLVASLSGFGSRLLVHPQTLEKNAYEVDVSQIASASNSNADSKPKEITPVTSLISASLVDTGKQLSLKCASCHNFEKGGAAKVGPDLWNIVNAPVASKEFSYSPAMKSHGGKWDYESLNKFLYKPSDFVKGTKMTFAGLTKDNDRAAIISWLTTLSDTPPTLK